MSLVVQIEARVGALTLDIALDTAPGTLVVVGPNGAGKTSLLSAVLGVLPARGRIAVGSTVLLDSKAGIDVPTEHRRIGYVPQDYGLFPHMTVRGNVAFALACAEGRVDAEVIGSLLAPLDLTHLAERHPPTLSGGERQRVALARALAARPRALLLDEPLAALDIQHRRSVRGFLRDWLRQTGLPTLVVSHDPVEAQQLGDRIAVVEAGRVSQVGTWAELVAGPATAFVEALVSGP